MVTRFEPARDLDVQVAAKLAFPFVDRLSDELLGPSKAYAPDAKVWVTVRDEKVRPTHIDTDGQTVPDNLRYKVPSTKGAGTDLARVPRDTALPLPNRINCRCESVPLPGVIAASINKLPTLLQGTRVSGGIESRFPRVGEAHEGTSEDTAVPFMTRAIQEVAAAHRGVRRTR
jgi:hypothetical protein